MSTVWRSVDRLFPSIEVGQLVYHRDHPDLMHHTTQLECLIANVRMEHTGRQLISAA